MLTVKPLIYLLNHHVDNIDSILYIYAIHCMIQPDLDGNRLLYPIAEILMSVDSLRMNKNSYSKH